VERRETEEFSFVNYGAHRGFVTAAKRSLGCAMSIKDKELLDKEIL